MASGWGSLGGLGEGLMGFGQTMNKQILNKKLEEERLKTEQAREDAKERRQQDRIENTITSFQASRDPDGVTWMQGVNAAGAPKGERRLASPFEIEQYNQAEEARTDKKLTNQLALDKLRLGNQKLEHDVNKLAADDEYESELRKARLGSEYALADQRNASAERSRRVGTKALDGSDDEPTDQTGFARQLLANNKDLVESYTKGKEASLTVDDVERIANSIVGMAADRGANNDWIQRAFREALTVRAKTKAPSGPTGQSLLGN